MEDPRPIMMDALKVAMKNKDTFRRDTIRMMQSAMKQVEIDTRKELSAEEAMGILQKEVKKRRDSMAEYEKFGRAEQAETERAEIALIEEFLPKQMSLDEIQAVVQQAIDETGVSSMKEMGKLMGVLMPRVKGLADGKEVNQVVRELLG